MSKKVKEQVVHSEIHLLVYQVSETQERILSSYEHKEDILFLINEFSKSQILREENNIKNVKNLKLITTPHECKFGITLPSVEIRKQEMVKIFDDLAISLSETEEPKIEKIN